MRGNMREELQRPNGMWKKEEEKEKRDETFSIFAQI